MYVCMYIYIYIGTLSEPIMVYNLCLDWLRSGGGDLGRAPQRVQWRVCICICIYIYIYIYI